MAKEKERGDASLSSSLVLRSRAFTEYVLTLVSPVPDWFFKQTPNKGLQGLNVDLVWCLMYSLSGRAQS